MSSIVLVSGTRADYGIYLPVAKQLRADGWDVSFLLTGMHLLTSHGNSANIVREDGFSVLSEVPSIWGDDTRANMGRSTARELSGFLDVLEPNSADWLMLLGDRGEMIAGALAGLYLGIPTAHLHGGEVSGSLDEPIRHAISKLSSLHFPATEDARRRLLRLGENDSRIFKVGAPRLDTILSEPLPNWESVVNKYELGTLKTNQYVLLMFHPVSTEVECARKQTQAVVEACLRLELPIICIGPNADAGFSDVLGVYVDLLLQRKEATFHLVMNFEPMDYLCVLKNCKLLVGNSSSGIIEAASYHVPVVNIGSRQRGRDRSSNVIDVQGESDELTKACNRAMSVEFRSQIGPNVYGDGHAAARISEVLQGINDRSWWSSKQDSDLSLGLR